MQGKIIIGFILTLILLIFIPLYWATEPGRQESALARQTAESVARGEELYASNCAACHGRQGEGGLGVALAGTGLGSSALQKVIARGVPGTAMAPWGREDGGPLQDYQIRDIVAFIESLTQASLSSPSPAISPTAPSVDARALYADKCSVCHGANRQGLAGLGPPLTSESLMAKSEAEIREIMQDGIAGTGMPPFGNILSTEEIDALLRFIRDTGK